MKIIKKRMLYCIQKIKFANLRYLILVKRYYFVFDKDKWKLWCPFIVYHVDDEIPVW